MIKSVKGLGRGGKRLGAGRPPTWRTRDFKTIRVPISLAGQRFQKFTPKTKQLAKILSGGRSCLDCGFNAEARETSDAKILPKGCQLRRGECVPYFVNHRRFHKWLMSLSDHFYKRMSRFSQPFL